MNFKRKLKYLPLPFIIFSVSACGYGLREYYDSNQYITGDFQKDTYKVWDSRIDPSNTKNKVVDTNVYDLNKDEDLVFTSYYDSNFTLIEPMQSELSLEDDFYEGNKSYYDGVGYGPTMRLAKADSSFRYGIISKLFDGQMRCHSKFQEVRVQIAPSGFGTIFKRESDDLDYFALSFKASYDFTHGGEYNFVDPVSGDPQYNVPNNLRTQVTLKVSFYSKTDNGYVKNTFRYKVDLTEHTNPDEHKIDDVTHRDQIEKVYIFFGFSFRRYELTRVNGFSVEYDFDRTSLEDNPMRDLTDKNGNPVELDYSLMLYEAFLPRTTWH